MPERQPWMDRLKRHRLALGIIGAGILAIGLCEWAEWPFLRQPVEGAAARAMHREVTVGDDFGLRILGGLRLRTDRLVLGPPPPAARPDHPAAGGELLQASGVRLRLPYSTVFGLMTDSAAAPRIDSLEVDALDLRLIRDAAGKANWRSDSAKREKAPLQLPEFGRLMLRQGNIALDDAPLQLRLQAVARTLEGDAPGAGGAARGLDVSISGSHRGAPLTARVNAAGAMVLAAADADAPPVPVKVDLRVGRTHFKLDGQARDIASLADLHGDFSLTGPSLANVGDIAGLALPNTPAFTLRGNLRKAGAVWGADISELALGSSRLHGSFEFDPRPEVPRFVGQLGGKRLSLPDLGPAFGGADPAARAASRRTPGRVLPQRDFDLPALGRMNAEVAIKLDELHLGTPALDVLAPLEGKLALKERVLTIDDLLARASGGEVRGRLAMDGRQAVPNWSADLKWSGVSLERFVKPRNRTQAPARPGGPPPGYISGKLAGNAQLRGSGRSTAAMLASLDGTARLWVRDGQLSHLLVEAAGLDLAQGLGMLIRGDESLPMRCAVASLAVRDGRVTPEVGVIDTRDSTLVASGGISLVEERLDLLLTVSPKDISPAALRTPIHIEGSFANPRVRVDERPLALRIGAAAVLAAITPLAGLLALVDLGDPDKEVCQQALQRLRAAEKPPRPAPRR